jgi:beta-galactosidase
MGEVVALIRLVFTSALLLLCAGQCGAAQVRGVRVLEQGWHFAKGEHAGAERSGFDDRDWQAVAVPHDYSIAGPIARDNPSGAAGGFFPGGVAWYRTAWRQARLGVERRQFVVFDGVMANSDVWINGHHLGHRPNGYVSFVYELTKYLKPGVNVLAMRVDNADQPSLRWYLGGGVYRQVRLVETGRTMIEPWGSFVTTQRVDDQAATVRVQSAVESPDGGALALRVRLRGPDGGLLRTLQSQPVRASPGSHLDLQAELQVDRPQRWDLDRPAMYTAEVTLLRDGRPVDAQQVPFGIRSFAFDAARGFFLNGRPMKIYGVALHADGGAFGAAVPLAIWQRRLEALRKLGVNAIRTAHNAVDPAFLDLCDRMGFLVMDEFFDQWTLPKVPYDYSRYFKDWAERDTADLVRRDRNHPSIILYSAGNEIRDTTQPQVAREWLQRLLKVYHTLDPTRPVTQALFRPNASHDYDNGYADLLDVVGQNYREQEILAAHAQKPTRKIIGTENTHEVNQWVALRDHPEYAGQFLWTGVDYLGEAGRWPTIGTGAGLLLTTGIARPRAFERQSWWTSAPMVRIARRVADVGQSVVEPVYGPGAASVQAAPKARPRFTQPLVADWSPRRHDGQTETLEIYTNADEVELSLNGVVVGTQSRHPDATPIVFKVPFIAGTLVAKAKRNGEVVATDALRTAGAPVRLELTVDRPDGALHHDRDDAVAVIATLVDANGVRIPDSQTPVAFAAAGQGVVAAVDNGNLLDHEPYQASTRRLYDGQAVAYLRATADKGKVVLRARVAGLPEASVTLAVQPAEPLVPGRAF